MAFTSREFLVFFITCTAAYFLLPHRFRWILLLAASYGFYAAGEARHLVLLISTSLVAYTAGRLLESSRDGPRRALLLSTTIVLLLAPLFVYKYLSFVIETANGAFMPAREEGASLGFDILLPLGISFFTFQALGYVIDVYRRDFPAERHPGMLGLYIAFFPQLIAGPIERARRLLPQFRQKAHIDPYAVSSGGFLILKGAFKKLVIADSLAPYVDTVYRDPTGYVGLPLLIATVFFAFQIYCDFSAYVDMARGSARILGIELMQNFDRPYGAASVGEFWHRWHISLSTWFRDYVYIPLGGSYHHMTTTIRNIAIVFLLSGLWHGANWTFVVWGGLHGGALAALLITRNAREGLVAASGLARLPILHRTLQITATFAFVCFSWIFFRANTLGEAWYTATHLLTGLPAQLADGAAVAGLIDAAGGTTMGFAVLSLAVTTLFVWHLLPEHLVNAWQMEVRPRWQRWTAYYAMTIGVMFVGAANTEAFIYFRF